MTRSIVRFVAAASVAVLTLVATGCSTSLDNAATGTDAQVSNSTLRDELGILLNNKGFVTALSKNYTNDHARKQVDTRVAAIWLGTLVQQLAVDREFNRRHLKVSSQDRTTATSQVEQGFGGAAIVDKFPKSFHSLLVEREARLVALARALQVQSHTPTVAEARAYYEQNKAQLFACASGKSVAHIVVATEAAANAVLAQARAPGADFAALAKQFSTDTTTKDTGGVVQPSQGTRDCYVAGQHTELDAAVSAAPVGQPTGPVKTASGYEVILVTNYTPPSFESVQSQLVQGLAQNAQQNAASATNAAVSKVLEKDLRAMHVHVAPQYGTWVIDSQGARVVPPKAPTVRNSRNPSPTTTTTSAATGG